MHANLADPLAEFNRLYKKMDEVYHQYAKRLGMSDMALWLLYSLYESGIPCTQRDFCAAWHYPPQTVNSALNNLEKQQIIERKAIPGNRKNKQIVLTEKGRCYMERTIFPLMDAEQQAFLKMDETERTQLLSLTRKYAELLDREVGEISFLNANR